MEEAYVDDCVFQHRAADTVMHHCDLALCGSTTLDVFEIPARAFLVVGEFGGVVAFVEVLEHGGEDFWFLGRKLDAFVARFEELRPAGLGEVGGFAEDVFVGGEESLCGAHGYGHDG